MDATDEEPQHLVKGIALHTIYAHFPEQYGSEVWESLLVGLSEEAQAGFRDPVLDQWYPEQVVGEFFHAVYDRLAQGDDDRFLEIVRLNMMAGVSRFFRVFLNFASARFVLKKLPVVFHRVRQSPAIVTPEVTDDGVLLHYENFPFCRDRIYRMISLGNCQALAESAIKRVPPSRVATWGPDSMTMEFELPSKSRARDSSRSDMSLPSESWANDPAADSIASDIVDPEG